ncbi:MAG: molybdopterin converting factor subunit 1 [Gammaproteobacteria bacterium]
MRVRYFASLRERMGRAEELIAAEEVATVADVWARVKEGKALAASILVAVNMEYADLNCTVKDGDEVAFFPPVTGG